MERTPEDAEVDPAFEAALAVLEVQSAALNTAVVAVEHAAGLFHVDTHDVVARLAARAEERFHHEQFLACEHADELVFVTLWAGAVLAAVCPDAACQAALDHVIAGSRGLGHCGLCDDRSAWLRAITIVNQPLAAGRLSTPAHDVCLWPEHPIEVAAPR